MVLFGGTEIAGYPNGLFDNAARVIAQIEDELLHALFAELREFLREIVSCAIAEDGNADVADIGPVDHLASHGRHVDLTALDRKRLLFAIAADDEVDAGIDRPADMLDTSSS